MLPSSDGSASAELFETRMPCAIIMLVAIVNTSSGESIRVSIAIMIIMMIVSAICSHGEGSSTFGKRSLFKVTVVAFYTRSFRVFWKRQVIDDH
jgi:hypothetical protein